jgi:GH15 family glucan-1,4-alpha-glucosidase
MNDSVALVEGTSWKGSVGTPRLLKDYAVLGDTNTAALVHRDGSVDSLSLPRFDSPTVFASLLGDRHNGRWLITAAEPVLQGHPRYVGDTLTLETELVTASGKVRVVDFMPPRDHLHPTLIRIVKGVEGALHVTTLHKRHVVEGPAGALQRNLELGR